MSTISKTNITQHINKLSDEHNVSFQRNRIDALADYMTYLSDDIVTQDHTKDLETAGYLRNTVKEKNQN